MVTATPKNKAFQKLTGINSSNCEKIFWFLHENGASRFTEMKKALKMNQKLLTENLKLLIEKNIVIKTVDGKYILSPKFSRTVNALLSFELIKQTNPAIGLFYPAKKRRDMNIHLLYGFKETDEIINTILNQINTSFNILRRLKSARDEKGEVVTKEAIIYSLSIAFSQIMHELLMYRAFRIDKPLTPDKMVLFYQKMIKEVEKVGKEVGLIEPYQSLKISYPDGFNLYEYVKSIDRKNICDYPLPASDDVAILSVPSFIHYKSGIDIHSIYENMNKIIYSYMEFLKMEYGDILNVYMKEIEGRKGIHPNKIWKIGVLLFMMNDVLSDCENLELVEYDVKNKLKEYFKDDVDFIWRVYKKYKDDEFFIPAWLRITWYEYLKDAEKDAIFINYKKKLEKMAKTKDYFSYLSLLDKIKSDEFPDKEKALEVIEYLIGEQICKEKKLEMEECLE